MLINNVAGTETCFLYRRLDILERKCLFKNSDTQRVSKSKEVLDNIKSSLKKGKVGFFSVPKVNSLIFAQGLRRKLTLFHY